MEEDKRRALRALIYYMSTQKASANTFPARLCDW